MNAQRIADGAIFGYTWDEIKHAQQGGALARRIPAGISKPLATEGDWELLERYGEAELRNRGCFGVLDRLENTRMANDSPAYDGDIGTLPMIGSPTSSAVKSARVRAGLTQDQASRVIGATRRAWQEWEAGRRNMPGAKWELFLRKVKSGEVSAEYKVHLNSEKGAVQATEVRYSDTERGIKQIAGRAMKAWAMEAIFFRRLGIDEFGRPGYDRITF